MAINAMRIGRPGNGRGRVSTRPLLSPPSPSPDLPDVLLPWCSVRAVVFGAWCVCATWCSVRGLCVCVRRFRTPPWRCGACRGVRCVACPLHSPCPRGVGGCGRGGVSDIINFLMCSSWVPVFGLVELAFFFFVLSVFFLFPSLFCGGGGGPPAPEAGGSAFRG